MVVMVVVASSWLVVLLLHAAPSHGGVGAHGKSDSEDKVKNCCWTREIKVLIRPSSHAYIIHLVSSTVCGIRCKKGFSYSFTQLR